MASSPQGPMEPREPMGRAPKSCNTSRRRPPWTRDRHSPCHMVQLQEGNNQACAEQPTSHPKPTCPSFRSISPTAPPCPQSAASLPRRQQLRLVWSDRCPWLNFECPNIRRSTPEIKCQIRKPAGPTPNVALCYGSVTAGMSTRWTSAHLDRCKRPWSDHNRRRLAARPEHVPSNP